MPVFFISIVFSAFFSGMEIAFLTANKLQIELRGNQGMLPSRLVSFFMKRPQEFITTCLVGNNICLVLYGLQFALLMGPSLSEIISNKSMLLITQLLLSTLLIVVTGEFMPKALFKGHANTVIQILIIPFLICYIVLYPVVFITMKLASILIKRVTKKEPASDEITFSRVDLDHYVKQFSVAGGGGNDEFEHEIRIFKKALDFGDVIVRECMVPRTEIVGLSDDKSIEELRQLFIKTHLSKILIYRDTIDHIIGYVHSAELFKNPKSIREVLLPVAIAPETMPAKEIMERLRQQRKSVAVVVDEFGGTSGIITIEDLVEEIFGEIDDEHDKEDLTEKKVHENEYLFSGRLEIDYINEKYGLQLPTSDSYATLAGLILNLRGGIPEDGEEIRSKQFVFVIRKARSNRVEEIRLLIQDEA